MPLNINGSKKYVTIPMEDRTQRDTRGKFLRTSSITEKYQKNLMREGLIYSDDLLQAVSKNDVERCREILANPVGYSEASVYFFHPLLLAAKKGRYEILQLLLDHGVDINISDKKSFNALHYAIQQRNVRCCNLLFDRNINIDAKDKVGNLPLHIAAQEGNLAIVQRLLDLKQSPNEQNKKRQTPLHFACMKGHEKILNLLLDKGGKWDVKDIDHFLPLHCSAYHGHYKCCEILVERSGDRSVEHINARNKDVATPLILAAKKGHSRSCQTLKDSDVNAFDSKGNTALHLAASVSFLNTVEVLIEMKPDIGIRNRDGNTCAHKAAMQKDASCLKLLMEYSDIDPGLNNMKQNVIHLASLNNSGECLRYLLTSSRYKAKIDEQDKDGKSALHLALNQKHSEVSEILIDSGINTLLQDEKDNIPLHIAAAKGMFNMCKLLVSGDGFRRVNDRNVMGTTPLHFAAMNGSVECCKLLLTKGTDMNSIDSNGFSPFHVAASEGNLEVLKLFTKKGGGYLNQVVEISGETPLHITARKGFYDCCAFILRNMKKDFILKLNNTENSALDEAYNAEQDEVFYLILSKIPYPAVSDPRYNSEYYFPFESTLHSYFHEALEKDKEIIQKAIVDSSWWYSGFSSCFCDCGQCPNLIHLTERNQELAERVYQKCIQVQNSSIIYNFKIFEDSYYVPMGTSTTNAHLKREAPFDLDTGKLRKEAIPYKNQKGHPLAKAVQLEHMSLMRHPLTEAYLNYKWDSYMRNFLIISVFTEIVMVLFLCLYLTFVKKTNEIQPFNVTNFCSPEEASSEALDIINSIWTKSFLTFCLLIIATFGIFIIEMHWNIKRNPSASSAFISILRFSRVFGVIILIFPIHFCSYDIILKQTWQWQIGIWTLLLSWFHMIETLNSIPSLSVFMPVTIQFVKSFLKVLMYLVLIVFIFAFIFNLLLQEKNAFDNILISFVKTTVWILGDLAYDDTFLDQDAPIMYPVTTNIIFLLLVTTISGFIINMIVAQPADHLELFRERANFYKIAARIKLFMRIDSGFGIIKYKYLVSHISLKSVNPAPTKDATECTKEASESRLQEREISSTESQKENSLLKSILEKLDGIEAQLASQRK